MSKKVTRTLTYDASRDAVAAMLLDPAFREAVLERQRVTRGSATLDGDVMTVEQARSSDGVPSFAKKFIGDEIVIVQTETWSSPDRAGIVITIPGKPGEVTGSSRLAEADGQTTQTVDLEVRVSIPLVGGKIESMIADILGVGLDVEHKVGVGWLEG
jgi:hypothetical protein